jgi:hypothetical protein
LGGLAVGVFVLVITPLRNYYLQQKHNSTGMAPMSYAFNLSKHTPAQVYVARLILFIEDNKGTIP